MANNVHREASTSPKMVSLIGKVVVVLALMLAGYLGSQSGFRQGTPEGDKPLEQPSVTKQTEPVPAEEVAPVSPKSSPAKPQTTIDNVVIHDESGKVVYRGQVDLRPTIERIESGRRLKFANDGSVFQNRERRLPKQASGYYREWVHPTPKLSGPGPQRVVTGQEGEVYYTPDHYRSFQRIE